MANRWERARSGLLFLIDKFKLSDGTDTTMSLWLTNLLTPIISRMTEFNNDSGTATGGSNTTLVDTSKVWQVDMWKHGKVEIIKGTKHYFADIISNTADTLTFAALAGGVIVVATEVYQIKAAVDSTDIKSINGTPLTGGDWTVQFADIETDIEATNTKLDTVNTKLDTVNTNLGTIETDIEATNTKLDTVNTNLGDIEADIESTNTKLDTVNTNLGTIETDIEATNTKLDTVNTNLGNLEDDVELLAPATAATVYNITIAVADTEYSQALPANSKGFSISIINGTPGQNFRWAYVTGKVATPTAPYRQLDQAFEYSKDDLNSSPTIYIAASNVCVAQIEVWG